MSAAAPRRSARPSRVPSIYTTLTSRELGWRRSITRAHTSCSTLLLDNLDVSSHLELASAHSQPVLSLSLDPIESRYLLSSSCDGSIALYDAQDRPQDPGIATGPSAIQPMARLARGSMASSDAHRHAVTAVQWFPHDTGCFASAGAEGAVKLWDTNELLVACEFSLPGRVHSIAMSSIATSHALIAACSEGSSSIHLCDPTTGAAAQVLSGHRAAAWALQWSPRSEHILASGGADRSVRLWDVRRANTCLRALDQHDSHGERQRLASGLAPAAPSASSVTTVAARQRQLAAPTAHNGAVTSLAYIGGGLLLLTAGRDHRMRLWDAETGANTLVHYPDAFNTVRTHKQLAVTSAAGGGAKGTRVFFPSRESVLVYDALSGRQLRPLKGHLGEVNCCCAAQHDARVFSGGDDEMVHVWTPPPNGLARAAPVERPLPDEDEEDAVVRRAGGIMQVGGGGGGPSRSRAREEVEEDGDAWSDDDDDDSGGDYVPEGASRQTQRGARRGNSGRSHVARKRVRTSG